jgi:hypothetical protein
MTSLPIDILLHIAKYCNTTTTLSIYMCNKELYNESKKNSIRLKIQSIPNKWYTISFWDLEKIKQYDCIVRVKLEADIDYRMIPADSRIDLNSTITNRQPNNTIIESCDRKWHYGTISDINTIQHYPEESYADITFLDKNTDANIIYDDANDTNDINDANIIYNDTSEPIFEDDVTNGLTICQIHCSQLYAINK